MVIGRSSAGRGSMVTAPARSTPSRSRHRTLDLGGRAEAFRLEVREWLADNRLADGVEVNLERVIFNDYGGVAEWADTVHAAGYMCITWPVEYGGRGLSEREEVVLNEEFARAGVVRPTRGLGESLLAPALFVWGTEEQRRTFLPRIADGRDRYCQGFSEPDAGSDLAGLQARGQLDGDEIVITGQKVWTSGAANANMTFCLVRSDPDAPSHQGISYVIVPMFRGDGRPNGVEVRPIRQNTGGADFAETFFEGARAPLSNVIGGVHNGWRVAMTTLGSERGGSTTQHVPFTRQFWRAVEIARQRGLTDDPHVRQMLARAFTNVELLRMSGLRRLAEHLEERPSTIPDSLTKLLWSEHLAEFTSAIMNLRGLDSTVGCHGPGEYEPDEWTRVFLFAPGLKVAGGANEVLRTVVGEKALGLPRDR
jgi:alkylation response protein AidB-like acyl-CoA dehydrogenase